MPAVQLACHAMATRFELVLHGDDPIRLRAAGEEAIEEIHRLEARLSFFRPDSEIAAINREAALHPVRVTPEVFHLIRHALQFSRVSGGAFDITVAPLMRVWGLKDGKGRPVAAREIEALRSVVGADLVSLDEARLEVRFERAGVMLDLGSIGKGYALDRAAEVLRELGVARALLHGGTSTVIGIGGPPELDAWKIAIERPSIAIASAPENDSGGPARRIGSALPGQAVDAPSAPPLAVVPLRDESLSVSAVWGKGFEADGRFYGHVIDPRTGWPVSRALLAAVALPSATESDALSTALLVRGSEMVESLRAAGGNIRCLVVEPCDAPPGYRVCANGISAII